MFSTPLKSSATRFVTRSPKKRTEFFKSENVLHAKLPFELYIRIFEHLEFWEILRCMRVCSLFKKLITKTASLQYIIELAVDALRNEPSCTLPSTLRLEKLKKHREAHRQLRYNREIRIPVERAGLWELCGGVLAQNTEENKLIFRQLPSDLRSIEEMTWTVDEKLGFTMRDFAMDPSQDLLVLVENADWQVVLETRLHLRSLSTGKKHPLVPKPGFFSLVGTIRDEQLSYAIQVFGTAVGLFIEADESSELAIWDWKSGRRFFDLASDQLYAFTMLSEDWVLLCITDDLHDPLLATVNFRQESPERQDTDQIKLIHKFHYPEQPMNLPFRDAVIRADPGPLSKPGNTSGDTPFSQDPCEFIIVVQMMFYDDNIMVFEDPEEDGKEFLHFIPAHYLLSLSKENSPSPASNFRWKRWAPIETRLLDFWGSPSATWVCYVYGTRYAFLTVDAEKPGLTVNVCDFNQLAIGRDSGAATMSSGNLVRKTKTVTDAQGIFRKAVHTRLPFWYRTLHVADAHDHCSVLCSEDALILVDEECGEYRIFVF
ncbi:hypothetical protein NLJ89_g10001 [Agrocybe chaxingu]|uniref:F-box domain-containing protein n=1 Tax=Agrocybe chaxingu TaxID=84603 RepID=A0A9W8MPC3_9AGAR|nr:hypothetical protein NLJ89_g10001 [Agrocybe chaxingu]